MEEPFSTIVWYILPLKAGQGACELRDAAIGMTRGGRDTAPEIEVL